MFVDCLSVLQLELDRFLTLHLRSRKFPSIAAYIETVRVLAELSDRVAGRPSPRLPRPKVGLVPLQANLICEHDSYPILSLSTFA